MPDICTDPWGLSDPEDWLHPIPLDWSDRENWASTFWLRYVRRMRAYGVADTRTNARIKLYLHKGVLQVCNDSVFPTGTWEDAKGKKGRQYDVPPKGAAVDPERSSAESRRRAKARVRDIALCNQFTHFVTWTLDPQKVDRYDPEAVYRKVRPFLSNMTQRKGFQYVVIPEYHKLKPGEDRPAIHFHGLCQLGTVRIKRAMKRNRPRLDKHGRPVYNMLDWPLGWSTVVPLDENYERAVNYVTKYISKQQQKILGKYYLSSRSLRKAPDVLPIESVPYDAFVDVDKLASGQQYEVVVYRDVKVCSEDFERSDI